MHTSPLSSTRFTHSKHKNKKRQTTNGVNLRRLLIDYTLLFTNPLVSRSLVMCLSFPTEKKSFFVCCIRMWSRQKFWVHSKQQQSTTRTRHIHTKKNHFFVRSVRVWLCRDMPAYDLHVCETVSASSPSHCILHCGCSLVYMRWREKLRKAKNFSRNTLNRFVWNIWCWHMSRVCVWVCRMHICVIMENRQISMLFSPQRTNS